MHSPIGLLGPEPHPSLELQLPSNSANLRVLPLDPLPQLFVFPHDREGFPHGSVVKKPPAVQATQEMQVQSLGQEEPLEEGMATHFSILV